MLRLVLIDLSGTLHEGNKALPGCVGALNKLKKWAADTNSTYRFVSNTTKEPKRVLCAKLRDMGFEIDESKLFTPLESAGEILRSLGKSNPLCLLNDAQELGMSNNARGHSAPEKFDSVVVGLAPAHLTYSTMNQAFAVLKNNPEAKLIATHRGKYYKDEHGLNIGPGPFVTALEEATGTKAITVGKPSPSYFNFAVKHAERELGREIDPQSIIMVGDDARDDVAAALAMGYQAVLVRTGKFRAGDDAACASLASFVELVDYVVEGSNDDRVLKYKL